LLSPQWFEHVPKFAVGLGVELAQLDLDEVSRVTGRNVGSGLLQIGMPENTWTDFAELGVLAVLVVPRHVVDGSKLLEEFPHIPDVCEEDIQEQEEVDRLREADPSEASRNCLPTTGKWEFGVMTGY